MKPIFLLIPVSIFLISCTTKPVTPLSTAESTPAVQPWEDGIRTNPENSEFEWWYFDFSFTDGSTAVIVFSTKNILKPGGKSDPGVSIVITAPDGTKEKISDSPGEKAFYASSDNLDIKTGNSFVKGDLSSCRIHFEKDDVYADLHLISEAPAWRPGSGKLYFDPEKKKYFAWLAAIPYGSVKGTLHYNGKTIDVSGTGYHDHNWGNVRLDRVMTQWYWGRARLGKYTLIFSQMLTSPKYGSLKLPVFYLAEEDKILSKKDFNFTLIPSEWRRQEGGRDYPEKIVMDITQKNLHAEIAVTRPVFIEAQYLLSGAPWIVRVLSRPFVNPWYFRFNADFTLSLENSQGKGNRKNTGIFEMMMLRGLQTVR